VPPLLTQFDNKTFKASTPLQKKKERTFQVVFDFINILFCINLSLSQLIAFWMCACFCFLIPFLFDDLDFVDRS
jgi:hypothetical protein